jgi:hypothetical protein
LHDVDLALLRVDTLVQPEVPVRERLQTVLGSRRDDLGVPVRRRRLRARDHADLAEQVRVLAPFEDDISFYDSNGGLAGTASGIQKIVGTPYADRFSSNDTASGPGPDTYGGGGNDTWSGPGTFYGGSGNDQIWAYLESTVSGGSGYDDFHLYFTRDESEFHAGDVVIRDFQPGIDDLFFEVNGEARLTNSGDLYTMHWFDVWSETFEQTTFQIVGITNLSPSDYVIL